MKDANLPQDINRWDVIFDFTEKEEDGKKVSNFMILPPEEFSIHQIPIEGDETPMSNIRYPQKYGGDLPDNDLSSQQHKGMAEFSILTSAADAQKKFDELQAAKEEAVREDVKEVVEAPIEEPKAELFQTNTISSLQDFQVHSEDAHPQEFQMF